MSLFGSSPADHPAPDTSNFDRSQSSLFEDEPAMTRSSTSALFEDDSTAPSPWDMPTPRKQQSRAEVLKNLIPANNVPEAYVEVFDNVVRENGTAGKVGVGGVTKTLAAAKLGASEQARILSLIAPKDGELGLERGEFNVLLALIGLAQDGETASLDSVDERLTNLPVPTLSGLSGSTAASSRPNELAAKPPQRPTTPPHSLTTEPAVPNSARTVRKASIEFPDTDPWATPDVHKTHGHAVLTGTNGNHIHSPTANGAPAAYGAPESALPGRTTSNFTTAGGDPGSRTGGAPPASGGTGWGYFDGNPSSTSSGYDEPSSNPGSNPFGGAGAGSGARNGGEGEGGDHTGGQAPIPTPSRTIGSGRTGSSIEENITISLLPEKEGMFMFQHHNYEVSSSRRASKVIRRYSDFVWLLDCLHKRYPFRVLPLLPPKRVAVNGNHLSNDGAFIEKRRRGLARFLNALVRHPVLGQEQLVVMFLTVPTELSVWRKQATYSVQDEFTDRPLPPGLEDSLSPQLNDLFDRTRNGVRRSADLYINICSVMDRLVKRDEGVAADHARIAMSLASLTETSADTYATDTNDVPLLNDGLIAMSQHLRTAQTLMEDEARAWDEGVLEDLKRQRDALVAVRDLFDRRERLDRDTIPFLERRIQGNETKLAGLRAKPEGLVKPGEIEKVVEAIIKDKESIVQQHNRSVFVKECIRNELATFQHTQYHVSRWNQDWGQERVKYAEMLADNWRRLVDELEGMPLGD